MEGRKMKQCSGCRQTISLDNFGKNKRLKDGKNRYCRKCVCLNNEKYNKSETAIRRAEENKKWITNYVKEHPCDRCGEQDIKALRLTLNNKTSTNLFRNKFKLVEKQILLYEIRCRNCRAKEK